MIAEDEGDLYSLAFDCDHVKDSIPEPTVRRDYHLRYAAYPHRVVQICDLDLHASNWI